MIESFSPQSQNVLAVLGLVLAVTSFIFLRRKYRILREEEQQLMDATHNQPGKWTEDNAANELPAPKVAEVCFEG